MERSIVETQPLLGNPATPPKEIRSFAPPPCDEFAFISASIGVFEPTVARSSSQHKSQNDPILSRSKLRKVLQRHFHRTPVCCSFNRRRRRIWLRRNPEVELTNSPPSSGGRTPLASCTPVSLTVSTDRRSGSQAASPPLPRRLSWTSGTQERLANSPNG